MHRRAGRFPWSDFLARERYELGFAIASYRQERPSSGPPRSEKRRPDPTDTDVVVASFISTVAAGGELTDPELEHLIEGRDATIAVLPAMPPAARARCGQLVAAATWTHSIEWQRRIAVRFTDLQGEVIERWSCVEMALRQQGPDGLPQFRDESIPFLQVEPLHIEHSGGRLEVGIYQDGGDFGLWSRPVLRELPAESGVFRTVEGLALPLGRVTDVGVTVEDSIIVEATITIDGGDVLLLAGEVEEGWNDEVGFVRFDESVLAFPDASAAHRIDWVPPRPR